MNGSPSALTSRAPSPRSASDSRKRGWPSTWSAVGWNCTNSRSATRAPAAQAIAIPSPDATSGLVVSRNTWPAPPVASSVARARAVRRVAVGIQVLDADGAAVLDQDRGGARVLDGMDAPVRRGAGPQGPADRPPGGVARVQHAADAVRRLAGQRDLAVRLAIEGRPPVHQLVDVGRALGHENAHRVDVAEPVAGGQRVLLVEPRVVVVAHRGGDAALGVAGIALGRGRLGQEEDLPGLRERQRGPERGDPAADDEVVRGRGQGRGVRCVRRRSPASAEATAREPQQLRYPM